MVSLLPKLCGLQTLHLAHCHLHLALEESAKSEKKWTPIPINVFRLWNWKSLQAYIFINYLKKIQIFKWDACELKHFEISNTVTYPTSGLDHLKLQRVSEELATQQCNSVTASQARPQVPRRQKPGLRHQLWKTGRPRLQHSPHIQTLLCQCSCLRKQMYKAPATCKVAVVHLYVHSTLLATLSLLTLSKQKSETLPQMLMRGGLMQKMPRCFNLRWA